MGEQEPSRLVSTDPAQGAHGRRLDLLGLSRIHEADEQLPAGRGAGQREQADRVRPPLLGGLRIHGEVRRAPEDRIQPGTRREADHFEKRQRRAPDRSRRALEEREQRRPGVRARGEGAMTPRALGQAFQGRGPPPVGRALRGALHGDQYPRHFLRDRPGADHRAGQPQEGGASPSLRGGQPPAGRQRGLEVFGGPLRGCAEGGPRHPLVLDVLDEQLVLHGTRRGGIDVAERAEELEAHLRAGVPRERDQPRDQGR